MRKKSGDQKLREYVPEGESRRGCGRFCNPVPELLVHAALPLWVVPHQRGTDTRCLQADILSDMSLYSTVVEFKLGMVVHSYHHGNWRIQAGGSSVRGQVGLCETV